MAYSDTEVEIKLKVDRGVFSRAERILKSKGKLLSSARQVDSYYNHPERDFLAPKYPFEWLSIRRRGGSAILNYKHFHPENARKTTHCTELEACVSDAKKADKLLRTLGFRRIAVVDKTRRNYSLGPLTVSLDSVKELGFFVEIESEKDFGSVGKTRAALWKAADSLGLGKFKEDLRGYPYLLLEKKGLLKN